MKQHDENYDLHWGYVDWKDKIVLDCGADYGSTAKFFLDRGAKKVIAVEYDEQYWDALIALSEEANIIPVKRFLSTARDFEDLISEYVVDAIKVDVEGGEVGLINLDCEYLRRVAEYAIEYHPGRPGSGYPITVEHSYTKVELKRLLREKFESCGFTVTDQAMSTLYAIRNDRNQHIDNN